MDIKSRKKFVEEVSRTIIKEHGQSKEGSFIFGISGKWGEGKSFFLNDLGDVLRKQKFQIIKINPWKYAYDKTTFLRHFIIKLKKIEKKILRKQSKIDFNELRKRGARFNYLKNKLELKKKLLIDWINNNQINRLEFEVSEKKLLKKPLFIFVVMLIVIFLFYNYKETFSASTLIFFRNLSIIFGLPILYGIATQIIVSQQSGKIFSTIDQFDNILKNILKNLNKTKIIVFVDDLDRVTPQTARDVLDNLRTFFDKRKLSFVVTGDHSVLERYIGLQTLQGKNEGEHLEEGRRFLKKIFNYYWRLPLLIDSEFDEFLLGEVAEKKKDLKRIFKTQEIDTLKIYLKKYFEKNFRQVKRFLDLIIFTSKIIDLQLKEASKENKKYFQEMKNNPLLVTRILMIQDLCTPLFEEILKDTNILFDLEYAAEKSDNEKIKSRLSPFAEELSPSRISFISQFLFENPKFFKETNLTVLSLTPFLYLAADASLGDQRGPSAEDFTALVKSTTDPAQIQKSIVDSGPQKIKAGAKAVLDLISKTTDVNQKNIYLKTIINALIKVPAEHNAQTIFVNNLLALDISQSISVNQPDRTEITSSFCKWLDLQKDKDVITKYLDKFPFTQIEEIHNFGISIPGSFSSQLIARWLSKYYVQNKNDAINKIEEYLPKLKINEGVKKELYSIVDPIVQDIISNEGGEEFREKRIKIFENYMKDNVNDLTSRIFEAIKLQNNNVWEWSKNKIIQGLKFWTLNDLERQIIESLRVVEDSQKLFDIFNFSSGKLTLLNDFWHIILTKKFNIFFEKIEEIIKNLTLASLQPSKSQSVMLFNQTVDKLLSLTDENRERYIELLNPNNWPWVNLGKVLAKKGLKKLLGLTELESVKSKLQLLISEWK